MIFSEFMNLKKFSAYLFLFLAFQLFSFSAFPATYQTCVDKANQVPCEQTKWDFGVEALYLRTTGDSFLSSISTAGIAVNNNRQFFYNPAWGWGIRLEGGYHFGTGNDLSVSWANFGRSTEFGDDATALTLGATAYYVRHAFNIVNIETGQTLLFGEKFETRAHIGIQYANFSERWRYDAIRPTILEPTADVKLDGWGPRVGIDLDYSIFDDLSFYGRGALGLIYMSRFISGGNDANFFAGGNHMLHTRILVPENDIKLGLKYTERLAQGELSAKVSWYNIAYLNAGVEDATYSWSGLSFGLNWLGNA